MYIVRFSCEQFVAEILLGINIITSPSPTDGDSSSFLDISLNLKKIDTRFKILCKWKFFYIYVNIFGTFYMCETKFF